MIEQLLDYTQFEDFKIELRSDSFDLNELIEALQVRYRNLASAKNITLEFVMSTEGRRHFIGDYNRIKQMLDNLIDNALKFTNHGAVVVSISQASTSNNIQFEVSDSGPGIPDEQKQKIFEPFSKTEASFDTYRGGSGIGLSLCQKIAETMGSHIELRDNPNGGSIFSFKLSLGHAQHAQAADDQPQSMTASDLSDIDDFHEIELFPDNSAAEPLKHEDLSPHYDADDLDWNTYSDTDDSFDLQGSRAPETIKIMVVEDNLVNQELIKLILDEINSEYCIAENGKDAIDMLNSFSPDIILMDKQMPVMDGVEATKRIRMMPDYVNVPIVAVTANVMSNDKQECLDAGMNGFVAKPIDSQYLYSVIQELTGIRVLEKENEPPFEGTLFHLENAKHFFESEDAFKQSVREFTKLFEEMPEDSTALKQTIESILSFDLCLSAPEYFQALSQASELVFIEDAQKTHILSLHKQFLASLRDCTQPFKLSKHKAYASNLKITGLNTDDALSRFHGNEKGYLKMLQAFSEKHSKHLHFCRLHLMRGATKEARRAAHTTKGLAATIGAESLQNISQTLEHEVEKNTVDIESILIEYEAEFTDCVNHVRSGLASLDS